MWLSDLCIRRPVLACMMIAALLLLGLISVNRVGIDLFPRVEFPYVSVETLLNGASPTTMETEVTDTLEEEVISTSGIENMRSVSSEGYSQLFIEFKLDENVDVKAQEVRDKINRTLADLPDDVEQPTVSKMDPDSDPILTVMLSGPLSIRDLTAYAEDDVKERLQRVPGVGGIQVIGGREREIRIWLNATKLRGFGVTVDDVSNAIRREHAEIPGGRMDSEGGRTEYTIKTKGEVDKVADFGDIVIKQSGPGYIRVRDVARIEDGLEDERSFAELDGAQGVSLEVRRQSGTNTVEVARAIKEEIARLKTDAPDGVRMVVARDVSRFIESSVSDVTDDIVLGIVLVVIVTMAFLLSFRATLIVATAIPVAIISTFFAFYVLDFTVNMITMVAISLTVGLLVDDAIVVLESIHREVEAGVDPKIAASKGTANVATAVVAATLSVMAVFLPIAFMSGVIGRFFFQYGLTIAVAVAISLFVSLTLTPMLSSLLLKKSESHNWLYRLFDGGYVGIEKGYVTLLGWALRARWLVLLLAAVSVYVGIHFAGQVPIAFQSKTDRSEFLAKIELPLGTGIQESKRIGSRVAERIGKLEHIELVFLSVGAGAQGKTNEVDYYLGLTPKADRDIDQRVLIDRVRESITAMVPEAKLVTMQEISWTSSSNFFTADVEVALRGPDLEQLNRYTEQMMAEMRTSGMFKDINSTFQLGKPEVQVLINRKRASDLGVSIRDIASTVRATIGGIDVTTFEEYGSRYDVRLRLDEIHRSDISKFDQLQIRGPDHTLVDFRNVAQVVLASGPAQIDRLNRSRKISVLGNAPAEYAVGELMDEMDGIIERQNLAPGYEATYQGASEQIGETVTAILFAFSLALGMLYMILAGQFNSFSQPIIIMLTAPLSFIGAFVLLAVSGEELSLFAQIGMVALMGLVMKNGILLVDYANQAREQGENARKSMLDAAQLRLRPVLMTAFSTVFGMIPIALATSDGAEFRNAMGVIVIGGLISSTLLTLVVVPTVYTLFSDVGSILTKLRQRTLRRSTTGSSIETVLP